MNKILSQSIGSLVSRPIIWNYLIIISACAIFLHVFLCSLFGISIKWINPFLMKVCDVGISLKKYRIQIRSINLRFAIFSSSKVIIVLEGVQIFVRANHSDDTESNDNDDKKDGIDRSKFNMEAPLRIFPKSSISKFFVKIYLLYFRFIAIKIFDLNVNWENTDVHLSSDSVLAKVSMQEIENQYKFNLNIRILQESVNQIEFFDTLLFDITGYIDMKSGTLSSIVLGFELRNLQFGWMPLLKILQNMKGKNHLKKSNKKKDTLKDEEYFIRKFEEKLIIFRYFVNLVEEINLSLHGFSLKKIPLANSNIIHCHKYHPLVFFELNVKSFVFNISRMHFDSPGYGLSYDYQDKPYHAVYNFTGISLVMNNTKMNTFKQIVLIPVMNFTGSSNYAYQTLESSRTGQPVKSRIIFIGHLSEPIIDFATDDISTAVLSLLQYIKHQDKLKKENIIPDDTPVKSINSYRRWDFFTRHQHILPIFDFKFGVENPVVMLKSTFEEEFYRILVLKLSLISVEFKSFREDLDDIQSIYYTSQKLNIHNLKTKYINNSTGLDKHIFKVEDIMIKQKYGIIPESSLESTIDFQQLKFDASDIKVLHGINHMFNELLQKINPLFKSFTTETNEFGCDHDFVEIDKAKTPDTPQLPDKPLEDINLVQLAEEILPDWLHFVKASFNQSTIILGSRSLLLSKELMKNVDSQTKNDLVNGELRKFQLDFDDFSFLAKLKRSAEELDSSSSGSSLEDDDKGLTYSVGPEAIHNSARWRITCNLDKVIGKVISERSSKRDVLKEKVFLKAINTSVDLLPQEQLSKILFKYKVEKIDMLYSVMTHFLIISCLHLLRNTILEFALNITPSSKHHQPHPAPKDTTRKSHLQKKLIEMIELEQSVEFFDLILVLPDRLKLRLELSKFKVKGRMNEPILINSYYIRICAESPTAHGNWARLLTALNGSTKINIPTILSKGPGDWLELANDTCNLTVPNQFIIYKIFENISVLYKTWKQLHHSLRYNTNEFVINPSVSHPAKIPKMKIKSKRFIFGMDDDPLEAELNMIFQIGILEQKMRFEKTKLLEKKIVEDFENAHKVRGRSTVNTFEVEKERHMKLLDDFSSFIPISKKNGGLFQKKHRHNKSNTNELPPSSASASLPVGDPHNLSNPNLVDPSKAIHDKVLALRESFSKSWITRVRNYRDKLKLEFQSSFEFLRGNVDSTKLPPEFNRRVLEFTTNPYLMNIIFEGLDLELAPPSFGIENIPKFIHDIGKGVPKKTEYSILIPLHIDLKLKELRCHLRDYPLPLVYMPAISKFQPSDLPGVRVHGDIVIGEAQIQSKREVREVFVPLVPGCQQFDEDDAYSLEVPKTLTAIKSFVDLDWELNSHSSTSVTWGTSYQPCIQQIMLNLDNFTKPPIDPSEKVGFWDKIRVLFHARMKFSWDYGGALLIQFKGSKDPYAVCAESSGFTLGFENNVILKLNEKDEPSEFLVVDSKKIAFGVPNHLANPLLVWSRESCNAVLLSDPSSNFHTSTFGYYIDNHEPLDPVKIQALKSSYVQKAVITLSGGVQFKLAIAFERKVGKTDRTSSFKPHYDVYLSNPKYVKDRATFDSYADFRSHFIHLGFTLISTRDGAYNKIQLTPFAFQYFFAWWRMFSNTLSVRHGALFGPTAETTKFSRHLYTIKYQAIVEPLFITDVYHDNIYAQKKFEKMDCVGLKGRASKFVLDLHQRKELTLDHNPTLGVTKKQLSTKFNIGKVDITELDVRALKGNFDLDQDMMVSPHTNADVSYERYKFEAFDNDFSWLDITDFIEIGQSPIAEYQGSVAAYPLMYTPRFLYFKHNSYGDEYQRDFETNQKIKPFGNEDFHLCTINDGSLAETQCAQLQIRLDELNTKLDTNLNEINLHAPQSNGQQKTRINQLKVDNEQIRHGIKFVTELLESYQKGSSEGIVDNSKFSFNINDVNEGSTFTNRFTVHNMLLKWNDTNRNIVFKFIYLSETSSTLKKFLQHKSLSQLDELIEDQRLANLGSGLSHVISRVNTYETTQTAKTDKNPADDLMSSETGRIQNFKQELREILVNFFYSTHDTYFIKLISPQIQLQSDSDDTSCLLVAAPDIELNIIEFDSNETEEEYNESIFEQRFGAILTDASIFVFTENEVVSTGKLFFRSSSYGSNQAWPPWLGVELCYDGLLISDHVLMNKTSLVFRYDRAITSAFISEEVNINKLSCDLSQAVITCDSDQYYTLYNIITQLLIYNEPREAIHKELESKMLFALDMSDLASIKVRIIQLQEAIRQADYILQNLASRRAILDDLQKDDLCIVASAREEASQELHILMHVSLLGNANLSEDANDYQEWFIRADDIKLHLLDERRDPFVDVILFNSHFNRVERSDRSDKNIISIQNLEVINLDKESTFPVIFSSYQPSAKKNKSKKQKDQNDYGEDEAPKLIQVYWNMDHPVGGIRVMRKFEVDLLPVQISVEESTGEKIIEFIFPNETPSESFDVDDLDSSFGDSKSLQKVSSNKSVSGESVISGKLGNIRNKAKLFKNKTEEQPDKSLDEIIMKKTTTKSTKSKGSTNSIDDDQDSEGVDEMVKRASNYLSFISFKLRSGSFCITFRGNKSRRLINVTDFVLNLPEIAFTNKTYTLLDVTMYIKKSMIKALLSHTGSIIGNKLFKHSDGKGHKQIEGISNYANNRIKSFRD